MKGMKLVLSSVALLLAVSAVADSDLDAVAYAAAVDVEVRCTNGSCLQNGWTATDRIGGRTATFTCVQNNCERRGWKIRVSGVTATATCKSGGCFVGGWRERAPLNIYHNDVTCKRAAGAALGDCWRVGWTSRGSEGTVDTTCNSGDCATLGATSLTNRGENLKTTCIGGDCLRVGYTIKTVTGANAVENAELEAEDLWRFGPLF